MLRALVFCVAVAILVAVAYWFAENPGSVVIQWRQTIIETEREAARAVSESPVNSASRSWRMKCASTMS